MPTFIALAFVPPATRLATLPPLWVAPPVAPLKLAFSASEKTPVAAVFCTLSVWLAASPTWRFVNVTGVGVALPTATL